MQNAFRQQHSANSSSSNKTLAPRKFEPGSCRLTKVEHNLRSREVEGLVGSGNPQPRSCRIQRLRPRPSRSGTRPTGSGAQESSGKAQGTEGGELRGAETSGSLTCSRLRTKRCESRRRSTVLKLETLFRYTGLLWASDFTCCCCCFLGAMAVSLWTGWAQGQTPMSAPLVSLYLVR